MSLFEKYYQYPYGSVVLHYKANYPQFTEWETKEEKLTSAEVNTSNEKLVPVTRYADLNPGDVVEIRRRITVRSSDKWNGIKTKDNRTYRIDGAKDETYPGLPAFKAMKAENNNPANWPPKAGDVWEAYGHEFHAQVSNYSEGSVILRPADPYCISNLSPSQLKSKNPVLRYRKGVKL